jgi:hypothetical protein
MAISDLPYENIYHIRDCLLELVPSLFIPKWSIAHLPGIPYRTIRMVSSSEMRKSCVLSHPTARRANEKHTLVAIRKFLSIKV